MPEENSLGSKGKIFSCWVFHPYEANFEDGELIKNMESETKPFLIKDKIDADHKVAATQIWKQLFILLCGCILGILITIMIIFMISSREMTAYSNSEYRPEGLFSIWRDTFMSMN